MAESPDAGLKPGDVVLVGLGTLPNFPVIGEQAWILIGNRTRGRIVTAIEGDGGKVELYLVLLLEGEYKGMTVTSRAESATLEPTMNALLPSGWRVFSD
jgi:hypothetical protein